MPGTGIATPHVPLVSFDTKAWTVLDASVYAPIAPQLPSELQETVLTTAPAPVLIDAKPGTSMAVPQVPSAWADETKKTLATALETAIVKKALGSRNRLDRWESALPNS